MTGEMRQALNAVLKLTNCKFLTSTKEQAPLEKRLQWLDTRISCDLARQTNEFKQFYTVLLSHLVGMQVDLVITSLCCKNRRYSPNFYGLGSYEDYSMSIKNNISSSEYFCFLDKTKEFREGISKIRNRSNAVSTIIYISCPSGCELFSRDDMEFLKHTLKKEFQREFDALVRDSKDRHDTLMAYVFLTALILWIGMLIYRIFS